jgi:flagellar biosynthesis chaperone FliJ
MAKTNLSQHEQHLKSLETNLKEIDGSYQKIVDSHQEMNNGLHAISNLIFKLFLIVNDLREARFEFEKSSQES